MKTANECDKDCLQVSASSPSCKLTDARALTSLKFVRINMACPNRDGEIWWQADLGVRHSLACNYYTVRADASGNFPHDWELQVCFRLFSFDKMHLQPVERVSFLMCLVLLMSRQCRESCGTAHLPSACTCVHDFAGLQGCKGVEHPEGPQQ